MNRLIVALLASVALIAAARADMYQDASNAKLPDALKNLGAVGGPSSATPPSLAFFSDVTGKVLGESRVSVTGYYYTTQTSQALQSTSPTTPALMAFDKTWDTSHDPAYPSQGPWQHPTLYSVCKLAAINADAGDNACRGIMAEAIDNVGGYGTFVEGAKLVGIGSASVPAMTGGAYGAVIWGQSVNSQYTVAAEGQTIRTGGSDAFGPAGFNPNNQMTVNFLASNGTTGKRGDAAFLVNPFNTSTVSVGFACGHGAVAGAEAGGACFEDYGGSAIGLDLTGGKNGSTSHHATAAILLPNGDPISIWKADGSKLFTAMYIGGDNALHLADTNLPATFGNSVYIDSGNLDVTPGTITMATIGFTSQLTVATLGVCNASTQGVVHLISDASAPAYLAPVTGGGTFRVMALCDGAAWRAH